LKKKGPFPFEWLNGGGLSYRARVIPFDRRTFPSFGSYLDLCFADERIQFTDLNGGKIKTRDYCSDHRALVFTIDVGNIFAIPLIDPSTTHRHAFKRTKWKKLSRTLDKNYNLDIPSDRCLSVEEINEHIVQLENIMNETISSVVPKYKPKDNTLCYVNTRIRRLQKYKSFLITTLNNTYKRTHINSGYSVTF